MQLWGGVPAKLIKFKWDIETIIKHEKQLYTHEERLLKEHLEQNFSVIKN